MSTWMTDALICEILYDLAFIDDLNCAQVVQCIYGEMSYSERGCINIYSMDLCGTVIYGEVKATQLLTTVIIQWNIVKKI